MFNLEQSIAEWRRQMLAAGIKSPVPLEELESHLREDIERQVKSGLNEQNAFNFVVQQFGESKNLKQEFSKIGSQRHQLFRDNPASLKILAIWYVIMGLNSAAVMPRFFFRSFWVGDLICDLFVAIFGLQILIGVGLLRRINYWRIAAFIWPAIALFCFFYPQVFLHSYKAHGNGAHGLTSYDQAFFGLPFPRIIISAMHILNLAVLFCGCYVLSKPSIQKLFLPTSTVQN
jgi:hypothetical protein